jgi:predicted HTH domain antitoxin
MTTLHLELPDTLTQALGQAALERKALEALLVRLYDEGHVSSGQAGTLLGISRVAFLDVLGQYGVSSFDPTMDIAAEMAFLARTFGNTRHDVTTREP